MARLTNVNTGVVVEVDDAKVERLGYEWTTGEVPAKRKPGRPRKTDDE